MFKHIRRFLLILFLHLIATLNSNAYDLVVAKDGTGNYTTIQAAINAVPVNATSAYTIYIKNGKYREKITIASNKTYIQLFGESVANTIIYYDDPATVLGTQASASFTVNANDFSAFNITFMNTYGDGSQAVSVLVNADRAVFKNCRFLGNQDTLYLKGAGTPKSYFKNCYIDGNIDFIFGSAVAFFDSCIIYAKTRSTSGSSYITAPNTPTGQAYGFVFNNARLPNNTGSTNYYLSRPWPSPSVALTAQKAVFLNSKLSSSILPEGWSIWDGNTVTSNLFYAEFQSQYFNGNTVPVSGRVPWSFQLTSSEASNYTIGNVLGSWNPCSAVSGACTNSGYDIAVSNFKGVKGASTSTFTWNISWPITGIQYDLYRSSDNVNFTIINSQVAPNDTAINFNYSENNPPAGQTYYYFVNASKSGYSTHLTDTISISSTPTISVASSLGNFLQGLGTPSSAQTYSVSGVNLSSDVIITPPTGYEISSNAGASWTSSSITLTPSSGALNSTTISVRLNSGTTGSINGVISHVSTGASTVNVALSGTVQSSPLAPSTVLQQWFLTSNNSDDAATRSPGVVSTTPSFARLYLSNGTQVAAVPAYSSTYGQAYGPTSNGDGTWTSIGGNLNRTAYQQFTITSASGYSVRLDSMVLSSSFYNTSSNTKLGIVYSRSNFTSDSTNISGTSGGLGGFASPIVLTNETAGTNATYRVALNSSTGVTISSGQTLTVRLYNSCSSTSAGRYGKLKNLSFKGYACAAPTISTQPMTTQSICQSTSPTNLSVVASGTNPTYTWYTNNTNSIIGATVINGANTSSYTPSTSVAGTTYFYCVVSGDCGNATSDIAQVNVLSSTSSQETIAACNSYTWNGNIYTASGVYSYNTTNAAGCDSVALLNLAITASTSNTTTESACDSYTWSVNSTTYTQSGSYTSVTGCHTEILNLTINASTSNTTTESACDLYTWPVNSTTYTQSGSYTSVTGCHTEILNLTITARTSNTTTTSQCGSYSWSVNSTTYSQSGSYTSVTACHTEILNLTITPNTSNTMNRTSCNSYTWSVNSTTYTQSGSYTSVSGCHSEILNLTIIQGLQLTFSTHPSRTTQKVTLNYTPVPYNVITAETGTISYQWYRNTTDSNVGGTLIPGATSSSYLPSTATASTSYYYCVITNEYGCSAASNPSGFLTVCEP